MILRHNDPAVRWPLTQCFQGVVTLRRYDPAVQHYCGTYSVVTAIIRRTHPPAQNCFGAIILRRHDPPVHDPATPVWPWYYSCRTDQGYIILGNATRNETGIAIA